MAEFVKGPETTLTNDENFNLSEEQSITGKDGKTQPKGKAEQTRDVRRKKEDALEGKENSHKTHETESREEEHGHSDKDAKGEEDSSQARQSLQSGQTTVQFSSGGGGIGALNSLLGLFGSSASLLRTDVGGVFGISNQEISLSSRTLTQALANQGGSFFSEELKNLRIGESIVGQNSETIGTKLGVEIGNAQLSHSLVTSAHDILSNIININASATEGTVDESPTPLEIIFASPTFIYVPAFNISGFFFNPGLQFAFQNSPVADPTTGALANQYPQTIQSYFFHAGLGTPSTFTYHVLGPTSTITNSNFTEQDISNSSRITITPTNVLSDSVTYLLPPTPPTSAPPITNSPLGITLTSGGDLYTFVTSPMSVLIKATGNSIDLPIRIDAGPGNMISSPNSVGRPEPEIIGSPITGTHSILTTPDANRLVGNDYAFSLNSTTTSTTSGTPPASTSPANPLNPANNPYVNNSNTLTTISNDPSTGISTTNTTTLQITNFYTMSGGQPTNITSTLSNFVGPNSFIYIKGFVNGAAGIIVDQFNIAGPYVFPSNTIFRHLGTTDADISAEPAAYGNFASFTNTNVSPSATAYSTMTFLDSTSYNLTFGGNVLDVYGTKYGEGDALFINLATTPSAQNIITMGGNTLAGFGTSYGDLQDITITGSLGGIPSVSPLKLTFNGNAIYVDKDIGSTLYPHLQYLNLVGQSPLDFPSLAKIQITFGNSVIQGNDSITHSQGGSDTFYGDIQNLGDINNPNLYNGFIQGVTVTDTANDAFKGVAFTTVNNVHTATFSNVIVTDSQGNNITWGNDVYSSNELDPAHPSTIGQNIYHFTLLGDTGSGASPFLMGATSGPLVSIGSSQALPVMQGNAIIENFNPTLDTLDFQISPSLFKSLEGLDTVYNKQISLADLDNVATFHQHMTFFDPVLNTDVVGTVITFAGGGSLDLEGVEISGFEGLTKVTTEVNFTYTPVAALPTPFVQSIPFTPLTPGVYVYGEGPFNTPGQPNYYNELDNYFSNSLFANYFTVQGVPDGVLIDKYGSITVTSTTPYLIPLAIGATTINPTTNQIDNATTTNQLFGFLDAPITAAAPGPAITTALTGISNIFIGDVGSTIVGGIQSNFTIPIIPNTEGTTNTGKTFTNGALNLPAAQINGGNLIIDTLATAADPATAYGDFQTISLTAQGNDNVTVNDPSKPLPNTSPPSGSINESTITGFGNSHNINEFGSINIDHFNFNTNAIDVNGKAFGVADSFTIKSLGGNGAIIYLTPNHSNPNPVDDSSSFYLSTISVGPQTIYGSGILTGDFGSISINVTPGTPGETSGFDIAPGLVGNQISGSLDVSSRVHDNTFTFGSTQVTALGNGPSTLYGNVGSLDITGQNQYLKVETSFLTTTATSTFTGNQFIFNDAILQGGAGDNTFYGHLNTFGDPFNSTTYNGFVNGVTVAPTLTPNPFTGTPETQLTITDANLNSITWGNNTYTGGTGSNIYNFTIYEDSSGKAAMQGFDTITNFDPTKDKLVFNIEPNLYHNLEMDLYSPTNQLALASLFSDAATFYPDAKIAFNGASNNIGANGDIYLPNSGLNYFDIYTLAQNYPNALLIQEIPGATAYAPPLLTQSTAFDPVFVNVVQPIAFAQEVLQGNYNTLKYIDNNALSSTTDMITGITTYSLAPGVTFDSTGTLSTLGVSGAVTSLVNLSVNDGINTSNTLPIQIFTINSTDGLIDRGTGAAGETVDGYLDNTLGVATLHAIETNNPGNTIIGEGGTGGKISDVTTYTPTSPIPAVYGSNVIYDVSTSATGTGHIAIGDVPVMVFSNDGSSANSDWLLPTALVPPATSSTPTITFDSNVLDVSAGTGAGEGVWGNLQTLSVSAAGGDNTAIIDSLQLMFDSNSIYGSGPIFGNLGNFNLSVAGGTGPTDAYIQNSTFTFAGNTISATGTIFGNMEILNMDLIDPSSPNTLPVGNGFITENTFQFNGNTLTGGSTATSLYAGIGSLTMENQETGAFVHIPTVIGTNPPIASQITDNHITFGNSTLTAGSGVTNFYTDIGDLFNTDFVAHSVILGPDNTQTNYNGFTETIPSNAIIAIADIITLGTVEVQDTLGNTITWGNDTFVGNTTGGNSYNITLLTAGSRENPIAVMQGNLTIQNFNPSNDIVNINLTPDIFSKINSDQGFAVHYNRTMTYSELDNEFSTIPQGSTNSILTFNFAGDSPTFDHGSIIFENQSVTSFSFFNPNTVITDLFTPAQITVVDTNPAPKIFSSSGGVQHNGIYGNVLDDYFNNIDPENVNSTYTVSYDSRLTSFDSITNLTFDQFGTATATHSAPNGAGLSIATITPNDPYPQFSNVVTLNLMVGEFNGTTLTDPNASSGGTFPGSAAIPQSGVIGGSYLEGKFGQEIMVGNADTIVFSPSSDLSNQTSLTYGTNSFGNNLIINTNDGNIAYGDARVIDFEIGELNSSTPLKVDSNTYAFGQNAFDVKGTVFGTADTFTMNVTNPISSQTQFTGDHSIQFSSNTVSFGPTTIYGEGTIFGDVNTLQITVAAGQNNFAPGNLDVSATMDQDVFDFNPAQIIILGNDSSNIYTNINSLDITVLGGQNNAPNVTGSVTFTNNAFDFGNSIVIGGNGKTDYFPDINDLSSTPFWNRQLSVSSTTSDPVDDTNSAHIKVADTNSNSILWGNDTLYLGTDVDTIHLNLLDGGSNLPVMQGNLTVNNFDLSKDILKFNLSPLLYKQIVDSGIPFSNFNIENTFKDTSSHKNPTIQVNTTGTTDIITTINFSDSAGGDANYGSITLHDVAGTAALASLSDFGSAVEFGTTFVGSYGTGGPIDTFKFSTPIGATGDFSAFKEFDTIKNFDSTAFDTSSDILQIAIPKFMYDTLSQGGLLTGDALKTVLTASAATGTGGLVVTQTDAQHSSPNGVTKDSTINFETSGNTFGAITLNNIDITDLSGLSTNLHLGSISHGTSDFGATSGETLYFNASPSGTDLSSFQQFDNVIGFSGALSTTPDSLQITLPFSVYQALYSGNVRDITGVLRSAFDFNNALDTDLGLGATTPTGGIVIKEVPAQHVVNSSLSDNATVDTVIQFVETPVGAPTSVVSGSITLNNFDITQYGLVTLPLDLKDFNTSGTGGIHLQIGSIQEGTEGAPTGTPGSTFEFNVPGLTFTTFLQYDHIINFNPAQDNLQITMPIELFNSISKNGLQSAATSLNDGLTNPNTAGINTTTTLQMYNSPNGVFDDTVLQFGLGIPDMFGSINNVSGTITLHNVFLGNSLSSLGSHLEIGSVQEGSAQLSTPVTFDFAIPIGTGSNFNYFNQFDHITNFEGPGLPAVQPHPDTIQIALPIDLFNTISQNGLLSGTALEHALETSATTSVGGIVVGTIADPITGLTDTTLNFETSTNGISGYISLDNNTDIQHLWDLGSNLHLGSIQEGTVGTSNTYEFVVQGATDPSAMPATPQTDFSYFQQFDHVINFNDPSGAHPDTILIGVPYALYDEITNNGTGDYASMSTIESKLNNGVTVGTGPETTSIAMTHPTAEFSTTVTGDNASNDTLLSFDTKSGSTTTTWGSILIHNDSIGGSNGNLVSFGSNLEIAAQGTAGSTASQGVTMNFTVPDAFNPTDTTIHDFSGFNNVTEHIIDFSTNVNPDTLTLTLSTSLYKELSSDGTLTGTVSVAALETGVAEPAGAQNSHVNIVQNGADTNINFVTNTITTGSIIVHNILESDLQQHLVVAHA